MDKLFDNYKYGSDFSKQDVVVKIFNPAGRGTWYVMNSDPDDPNYMYGIVDLFEVEAGGFSKEELETIRIKPFNIGLERDKSFKPMNALELFEGLQEGKTYKLGGNVEYKQKEFKPTDDLVQ
jgi:homoserine acetyltransferase